MTGPERHVCQGTDGEWTMCLDGRLYVPCESELCGGACEDGGDCICPCHGGRS